MKRLTGLPFVFLCCLLIVLTVQGQSDDFSRYTAPDGSFSFEYPAMDDPLLDASSPDNVFISMVGSSGVMFIRVFNPRFINTFLASLDEIPEDLRTVAAALRTIYDASCSDIESIQDEPVEILMFTCDDVLDNYVFPLDNSNWGFITQSTLVSEGYTQLILQIIQSMEVNPEVDLTSEIQIDVSDTPARVLESLQEFGFDVSDSRLIVNVPELRILPDVIWLLLEGEAAYDYIMMAQITRQQESACLLAGHVELGEHHRSDSVDFRNYLAVRLMASDLDYVDTYGSFLNSGHWTIDTLADDASHHLLVLVRDVHMTLFVDGEIVLMDASVTRNPGNFAVYTSDSDACEFHNVAVYTLDEPPV